MSTEPLRDRDDRGAVLIVPHEDSRHVHGVMVTVAAREFRWGRRWRLAGVG